MQIFILEFIIKTSSGVEITMKSIYLDTSNIALLTKIQTKSPKRFQIFRELWTKNNFVLALSRAHLFEIARHNSQEEIQLRFKLIEELLPIRVEMNLLNKEIILAFINKRIFTMNDGNKEVRPNIFEEFVYTPDQFNQYRAFGLDFMRSIFNLSYEAHTAAWKAHSSEPHKKEQKVQRLKDFSNQEMTAENIFNFQEINQQVVNDLKTNLGLPDEFLQQGFEFVEHNLEQFHSRVGEVGYLDAFAEFINVDSSDNKTLKKSVDSLLNDFWFRQSVESIVSEISDDSDLVDSLITKILIEDCPGSWLCKQIESQIKKSGDFSASNELDLEHISHLPYVDVFLADKRIVEMTKQVFRSADKPKQLEDINLPITISDNIEALEKAIFEKN